MATGRSHSKRRAPADSTRQRPGVLGALLVVLGILLVITLITRGDRAPVRRGSVSAPATDAGSHAAPATRAGPEARGTEGWAEEVPAPTAESDASQPAPYEGASPRSEDRGGMPRKRRTDSPDVAATEAERGTVPGGTTDGSPRRHRGQRWRADAASSGRVGTTASPGQPGVVAGEVGTQRETLGEAQRAGPGGADRTAAVEAPPPDPLAFAKEAEKEYETLSETDAGEVKGLTGGGGTISFWLQPAWDGTSQEDASFVRIGDDRLRVYKSATYLRFDITDAQGQPTSLGMPIADWNAGDWHQVVTTWDGHVISFFIDGKLIGQNAYNGQIELPPDPKLLVGTNAPEQAVAPGLVAGVRVQNRPLTPDAVSRRFEGSKPPQPPPR